VLRNKLARGLASRQAATFGRLVLKHKSRFIRFSLVGASGVLVNTALLYVLTEAGGLNPVIAAVFATEAAILSNFSLNDLWTFRDVKVEGSWIRRALRYNCGAFGGLVMAVGVLALLTHALGLHYLVANLIVIGVSMGWNYTVSYLYTWATPEVGKSAIYRTSFTILSGRNRLIV
jgi:putative flippase GtrA